MRGGRTYLSSQRHDQKGQEIENQDGPENWNVEDAEKCCTEGKEETACDRVPALEFG